LELKTRYTTYDFLQILELSSKYSVILYWLIKEKWGLRRQEFVLTFDELQKIMDTSFKRWTDFNRKVLKPAVEEVSKKTKFTVEYKPLKTGKKVDKVIFFVKEKLFLPTAKGVISPQELYRTKRQKAPHLRCGDEWRPVGIEI
jgi:plasmid replication initiation protein